jgi:pimeloyl-ACP methyl ester carboxylesterase
MFTTLTNAQQETLDFAFHPGKENNALVILGHGVTGNKDRPLLIALAEALSAHGWPCLRLSFSGNGASAGSFEHATITKEIADLQAVLDAIPADIQVAYIGHSMGGAVGVLTAVRDEKIRVLVSLAGMVFTADFFDREFADIVAGEGCMWEEESCPLSQEFADDLHQHCDLIDAAAAIEIPWLLIHGTADDVVPAHDSESAFAAATVGEKKLCLLDGAGHSFDENSYPQLVEEINSWLAAHLLKG